MTPLHPTLYDKKRVKETERKGDRMPGSDPPRPCQLILTSLVAPCRLILPNYIPHWQKVGPRPPPQKAQVAKPVIARLEDSSTAEVRADGGCKGTSGDDKLINANGVENLHTEVHRHPSFGVLATVHMLCLAETGLSGELCSTLIWQVVMDGV